MIAINFASRNYRLSALIRKVLLVGSVILSLTASALLLASFTLHREATILEKKLKDAESADAEVKPVLAERAQLEKSLSAMSGLLESRRFSWTTFLTNIESVVPKGVAMRRVDFNPQDGMLSFEGVAQSPEALRDLIVGLERSASFKEPLLKHQSQEKGSISFNVVAIYYRDKNAAVARINP
ncbi:MAG TPA: PilN domain-containing protein [Nitrospirota bacterium]|nr:PilN domain-containing protein [Nitrospirota bacterium]